MLMLMPGAASAQSGEPQKHQQERLIELHKLIEAGEYKQAEEYGRSLLDDNNASPLRWGTYGMMNRLFNESGDHAAAVQFWSAQIERASAADELGALYRMRSKAYRQLGDEENARWDQTLAQEMFESYASEAEEYHNIQSSLRDSILAVNVPQWQLCLGAILAVWICSAGLNVLVGNRQRREGHGTWGRLIYVSGWLAMMQTGPMIAVCTLHLATPEDWYIDNAYYLGMLTTFITLMIVVQSMRPPARWNIGRDVLPEVDDPQILENIEASAQKLGIATPVVRRIPALGDLALQAYAGGLPAPSVAAGDGVLLRLNEEERAAIMGHELGHIANNSLWYYPLMATVSCTLMVLATMHFTFWVACVWGLAFYAGLIKIVSRYFEFDCDRKAAFVAGHQEAISAIDKVHITSPLDNQGWISFFAFSMATHPSHEERLTAIANDAPLNQEIKVTWSKSIALRRHRGALAALVLWLMIVFVTPFLPVAATGELILGILYMGVWLVPSLLLSAALRKSVTTDAKRATVQTKTSKLSTWLLILSGVIFVVALEMDLIDPLGEWYIPDSLVLTMWLAFVLFVLYLVFIFVKGLINGQTSNLAAKVAHDMHLHHWQTAIDRAAANQRDYMRDLGLRHNIALCHWKLGEQDRALKILGELRKEQPGYHQPWLTAATLHLERDEIDEALKLSEELIQKSPDDYGPYGIAAICHRLKGNYDAVNAMLENIEKYSTHNAFVPSSRGMVAMDQGDAETAREYFIEADHLAPSDPGILLAQAEWEIRFGSRDQGESILVRAKKLLDASPFSMLNWRVRAVEQLIAEATPEAPIE